MRCLVAGSGLVDPDISLWRVHQFRIVCLEPVYGSRWDPYMIGISSNAVSALKASDSKSFDILSPWCMRFRVRTESNRGQLGDYLHQTSDCTGIPASYPARLLPPRRSERRERIELRPLERCGTCTSMEDISTAMDDSALGTTSQMRALSHSAEGQAFVVSMHSGYQELHGAR